MTALMRAKEARREKEHLPFLSIFQENHFRICPFNGLTTSSFFFTIWFSPVMGPPLASCHDLLGKKKKKKFFLSFFLSIEWKR